MLIKVSILKWVYYVISENPPDEDASHQGPEVHLITNDKKYAGDGTVTPLKILVVVLFCREKLMVRDAKYWAYDSQEGGRDLKQKTGSSV